MLDAYIKPVLRNYLGRVSGGMAAKGFAGQKFVMNSSGGALTSTSRKPTDRDRLLRPAGGVFGALHVARETGRGNVLSGRCRRHQPRRLLIVGGEPMDVFEARIENFPILQPIFDLHARRRRRLDRWIDNALLRVGPESAGAVPGTRCYGRGGTEATVTDAAVVLGYIDTGNFMGGSMNVARDLAEDGVGTHVAEPLGLSSRMRPRARFFDVLISRTASSIKEMMLERGLDPGEFSMLDFVAAAAAARADAAERAGDARTVIPPLPSVFSAWGMLASDLFLQRQRLRARDDLRREHGRSPKPPTRCGTEARRRSRRRSAGRSSRPSPSSPASASSARSTR